MICSEMQRSIVNIFSNFSLVGGSAIVEMNKLSKVYLHLDAEVTAKLASL